MFALEDYVKNIATYLQQDESMVRDRINQGFWANHVAVANDYFKANPQNTEDILKWYTSTTAYIWELSAYHLEPLFSYMQMCENIFKFLVDRDKKTVLVLGDGIGTMSLYMAYKGMQVWYNDLAYSKTCNFATARFTLNKYPINYMLSANWTPPKLTRQFDAVLGFDFMEHVPNIEQWAHACYTYLETGGLTLFHNAFAEGDPEHDNSIPMHLSINNKYLTEWDNLMDSVGFRLTDFGNWRTK